MKTTTRCFWAGSDPDYVRYHDTEWGRPVDDERRLFEKICLEGFQSGLSWLTILRKRQAFREVFEGFDPERVARFGPERVDALMNDARIVRNRKKIEATIENARRLLEWRQAKGSFASFIWSFEPPATAPPTRETIPAMTEVSRAMSAALRARGFRFVGPTTAYAFMQAMGLVNDHTADCAFRAEVDRERAPFRRP